MDGGLLSSVLRQVRSYSNHGKLSPPRHLNHVEITVTVARIKSLHRNRNQEVALPFVAESLAAGGMTDSVGLMQRMRNVVGKGALFKNPLAVGRAQRSRSQHRQG